VFGFCNSTRLLIGSGSCRTRLCNRVSRVDTNPTRRPELPTLKLVSVSQVIEELNCVVLIYSNFCLLKDILTKEIIGCGTKRGGLYYVDDVKMGHVFHIQSDGRERQIRLWHQHLGHPNFGYLKHLLPDLFSNIVLSNLKCTTCIVAKSHRTSYLPSLNKSIVPFTLVHSDVWGPSPISISSAFVGSSFVLTTVLE
jgi:hypothetical protein